MSLKTIRILSTIAMIIYAVSLALHTAAWVYELTLNWQMALLNASFYHGLILFALSLVLMLMVRRLKTDRASKKCVIVLVSVLGGWQLLSFGLSFLFARLFNVYIDLGSISWYSFSVFSNINSIANAVLNGPALVLMVLTMGGFCNRAGRLQQEQERPAVPEAAEWIQEDKNNL